MTSKSSKISIADFFKGLHRFFLFLICPPLLFEGKKNTWVFPTFHSLSLELQKSKRGKPATKHVLFWESLQNSRLAIFFVVDDLGISFKPRCLGK